MSLFGLIVRAIKQRALSSTLTALSVALGVMLVTGILLLQNEMEKHFREPGRGYSLVVGAPGSALQLVLNAIYHVDKSPGLMPMRAWYELEDDDSVAMAVPYAVGDSFRGHRVVATTDAIFDERFPHPAGSAEEKLAEGRPFHFDRADLEEALHRLGATFDGELPGVADEEEGEHHEEDGEHHEEDGEHHEEGEHLDEDGHDHEDEDEDGHEHEDEHGHEHEDEDEDGHEGEHHEDGHHEEGEHHEDGHHEEGEHHEDGHHEEGEHHDEDGHHEEGEHHDEDGHHEDGHHDDGEHHDEDGHHDEGGDHDDHDEDGHHDDHDEDGHHDDHDDHGHHHDHDGTAEAVLGAAVARELNIHVGDAIEPTHGVEGGAAHEHEHFWTVVGILKPTNTPVDDVVFINLDSFFAIDEHASGAMMPGTTEAGLSSLLLFPRPGVHKVMLLSRLNRRPDLQIADVQEQVRNLFDIVGSVDVIFLLVSIMVIIIGVLSILVAIYNTMSERRREVAILRAIGAKRSTVFSAIVGEATILTLMGATAGVLMGHALVGLTAARVEEVAGFTPDALGFLPMELMVVAIVLVAGAIAGLVPAWKAYQTDVASNLRPLS